ncbi:MAG: trypsin-like peptidase domain-containing protein [Acidobacteriota bacterium]|nr:trypsin-like peptidase domain-containing protein [Acidobacteriota bacterium]
MKTLRPFLIGVLLAGAFFYYTSHRFSPSSWITRAPVQITEAQASPSLDSEEQNNVDVYKRVVPSVVNITTTSVSYDFFFGPQAQQGAGSGFVIDKNGHILTNYHVIDGARKLEVILENKKHYPASVIGADKSHDLAVIQIKAPNLQPVTMGNSSGLQVGQKVLAIGNPFGIFNGTMTRGIVSSIRQVQEPDGTYIDEAIQTDAAINPGNSGGPLLNSHGEVIGINTMIASASGGSAGVGFAIPINSAKSVLNDLVQYGRVKRPTLGIRPLPVPMTRELAEQLDLPVDQGVLVMQVVPGSAAAKAGIQGGNQKVYYGNYEILIGGDLIVEVDGQTVNNVQDLAHVMNNHRSGDTVNIVYYHGHKRQTARVQLDEAKGTSGSRV